MLVGQINFPAAARMLALSSPEKSHLELVGKSGERITHDADIGGEVIGLSRLQRRGTGIDCDMIASRSG